MTRKLYPFTSFLILIAAIFWSIYGSMPREPLSSSDSEENFSTSLAFKHVEELSMQPHYIGNLSHSRARNYIVNELQELGLMVQTQESYSLNKRGVLTRPQNILAKIKGSESGKALLLLTHYDSAVHSSYGASDAASGVATILEGVRAFLASETPPKNDIILLFTDAEEVGLNGAQLFVNNHPWSDEVGLALNFEARGSGGNSFMLLETNQGNKALIEHFIEADPEFPVTNSLAYSVYKMLPNDTDLTVLREEGNIKGFNFAFIDDHFDYHTANDTPENLDLNTLAHQGSYIMPLLKYFSQIPLENLDSTEDLIYFNLPVLRMIKYPFDWIMPMLYSAGILFVLLLIYGIYKGRLKPVLFLKGFLPMMISLLSSGILVYALWKFCLFIYPQYLEMEHGFTYNGYYYIAAVIFLTLGICFYTYNRFRNSDNKVDLFIAPLALWILICALAAGYLEGAAYFVVPVFFGLFQLFFLMQNKKPNLILQTFLSLPAIFILMPFVTTFPVALGLNILFVSAILVVLLWMLFWPVFSHYQKLQLLGFLCILIFFSLFGIAHFKSDFNEARPKPNSLVYLYDADEETATWNSYDSLLDEWTATFFEEEHRSPQQEAAFSSKYQSGFTRSSTAPVIQLQEPSISIQEIEVEAQENTVFQVKIVPKRNISRMEFFTDDLTDFSDFKVNGLEAKKIGSEENSLHVFKRRWARRLLTYYAVNQDTLRLEFQIEGNNPPDIYLYEASHDLLENPELEVAPREEDMIPRPFVLNDAIVLKKKISFE